MAVHTLVVCFWSWGGATVCGHGFARDFCEGSRGGSITFAMHPGHDHVAGGALETPVEAGPSFECVEGARRTHVAVLAHAYCLVT
ncbi:hypothetical protein [Corynebacterium epidermidicanis]|uniref:hypothetical protein n=1 Tax=Corynebacterium epidermidicanis TaxID=1050174 RepID=UPI0011876BC4|nr:hypothetical protein [Corynebacterium epidermidicanis]